MQLLLDLISQYGVAFVFICIFAEQAGVPIPAYPVLLVAGSLAAQGAAAAGRCMAGGRAGLPPGR